MTNPNARARCNMVPLKAVDLPLPTQPEPACEAEPHSAQALSLVYEHPLDTAAVRACVRRAGPEKPATPAAPRPPARQFASAAVANGTVLDPAPPHWQHFQC
jgi:hypothetical protein